MKPVPKVQPVIGTINQPSSVFDTLPDAAYVRQSQLIRDTNNPDSNAPLPFSSPTLWRRVKDGTFPKPIKLGERCTAWKVGDIRQWLAEQAAAHFVATGKRPAKVA